MRKILLNFFKKKCNIIYYKKGKKKQKKKKKNKGFVLRWCDSTICVWQNRDGGYNLKRFDVGSINTIWSGRATSLPPE